MWSNALRGRRRVTPAPSTAPARRALTQEWTLTLGAWPPEDLSPDRELLLVLALPPHALQTCRRGLGPDPYHAAASTELSVLIELGMGLGNPGGNDPGAPFAERFHAVVGDGLVTLHLAGVPWIRRPALPEDEPVWRRRETCLLGAFADHETTGHDATAGPPGDSPALFEMAYWEGRGAMARIHLGKR